MIEFITDALKAEIDKLELATRSAGLVRTAERVTDKGVERYPIAVNVDNPACWDGGRYKNLVPDSSQPSMFYIEQRRDLRTVSQTGDFVTRQGEIRLIFWYNIKLANLNDSTAELSDVSSYIRFALDKLLSNRVGAKRFPCKHPLMQLSGEFWLKELNQALPSVDIFDRYSYKDQMQPFIRYPYGVVANDYQISFCYNRNCVMGVSLGEPETCEPNLIDLLNPNPIIMENYTLHQSIQYHVAIITNTDLEALSQELAANYPMYFNGDDNDPVAGWLEYLGFWDIEEGDALRIRLDGVGLRFLKANEIQLWT